MDEIECDEQLVLTDHARKRGRQRNFSDEEVRYVLRHGRKLWRTGICFHFLAAKDVPLQDRHSQWAQRLVGTSVLVSHDSKCIITLYRNQKALHHIKKKSKRRVTLRGEQAA
jgi:Domain of unknown function (DUF4258)